MSSNFLDRFRSRMQILSKNGKLEINDTLRINTKISINQCHQAYKDHQHHISSPKSVCSPSPINNSRNYSCIPRFFTPIKGYKEQSFNKKFDEYDGNFDIFLRKKSKNIFPALKSHQTFNSRGRFVPPCIDKKS